jgi:hypothetical protein
MFESQAFKQAPDQAFTHVLLIGCGAYPGLAAANGGGLEPLTSPILSAHAMAKWFLSGEDAMPAGVGLPSSEAFYNPEAPLGSLAMLTSPSDAYTTPAGDEFQPARPTLDNIRGAYLSWLSRLGKNPASRGVFYFCGHGLSDGVTQYLVADDFGEDGIGLNNEWPSIFHVSNTCQATIRRTPASLFYFLDACMELNEALSHALDDPRGLIPGAANGSPLTYNWAVLRATTTNRMAYATKDQVARFTAALLQALRGHCGSQSATGSYFDVCFSDLRDATVALLDYHQRTVTGEKQKLGPSDGEGGWDVPLHVQAERPSVLVELDVDPNGFRPVAHAFVEDPNSTQMIKALSAGPASFTGATGEWTLGIRSTNGAYKEKRLSKQLLIKAVHRRRFSVP